MIKVKHLFIMQAFITLGVWMHIFDLDPIAWLPVYVGSMYGVIAAWRAR